MSHRGNKNKYFPEQKDRQLVQTLANNGRGELAIAKELGISRATLRRAHAEDLALGREGIVAGCMQALMRNTLQNGNLNASNNAARTLLEAQGVIGRDKYIDDDLDDATAQERIDAQVEALEIKIAPFLALEKKMHPPKNGAENDGSD
ncbi:hypothetical protein [Shimia sp.]|uniref:hypothetical protein n=1 Tax=Shimia sp. TaxID=1954381 RepID=UPI003299253E